MTPSRLALDYCEKHPSEAAAVLERLEPFQSISLLESLDPHISGQILAAMYPLVAGQTLELIRPTLAGSILSEMSPDVAAAMLRKVRLESQPKLIQSLKAHMQSAVMKILDSKEGTAGSMMDPLALSAMGEITVEDAWVLVRERPARGMYYIYIVDRERKLVGVVSMRTLALNPGDTPLYKIMETDIATLQVTNTRMEIVHHPGWSTHHTLPVVGSQGEFLGALRYFTLRQLEREKPIETAVDVGNALGELFWMGVRGIFEGIVTLTPDNKGKNGRQKRSY